ncbi:MAG: two-component regulator propeller domain-containing protein, partial [Acidobacteriota bacterium]
MKLLLRLKLKILLIVLILFSGTLRSVDLNFYFKHINNRDGLPHNSVNSVIQDKTGFIWFATENGLSRYDGYSFVNYSGIHNSEKSIGDNVINTVELDRSGKIWAGTNGGGLNRYDHEQEHFFKYYPEPENRSDLRNRVFSIFEENDNTLWIGTMGNGLYSFNKETERFLKHTLNCRRDPKNENILYKITGYQQGNLLIGTSSGLYKYNIARNSSSCLNNDINKEKNFSVYSFYIDSSGLIWVGTSLGVLHLDQETDRLYFPKDILLKKIRGHVVNAFHEDKYNRMWIGSWNGLYIIDKNLTKCSHLRAKSRSNFDLSSRFITDIYEDKNGVIWIASLYGVDRYDIDQAYFRYYDIGEIASPEISTG